MASREQNEKKFRHWENLPGGGRRYLCEIIGRYGGKARYLKEVDAEENTLEFRQEIYSKDGKLIEIHEKYPLDKGHQKLN